MPGTWTKQKSGRASLSISTRFVFLWFPKSVRECEQVTANDLMSPLFCFCVPTEGIWNLFVPQTYSFGVVISVVCLLPCVYAMLNVFD
jgi:hypothetical protein